MIFVSSFFFFIKSYFPCPHSFLVLILSLSLSFPWNSCFTAFPILVFSHSSSFFCHLFYTPLPISILGLLSSFVLFISLSSWFSLLFSLSSSSSFPVLVFPYPLPYCVSLFPVLVCSLVSLFRQGG